MNTFKTILKWFFGITFLLSGIVGITDTPIVGVISILIGIFILPPTFKLIEQKTKYVFPSPIKWVVVIAGIVLMGATAKKSAEAKDKDVDPIVERASAEIDKGNFDSAFFLIKNAKSKYSNDNNKATDLEKEIENSKSSGFVNETLAKMTDDEFSQLKDGSLNKPYFSQKTLNAQFISLLKTKMTEREKIIAEEKEREEQARIDAELAEKQRKQTELNKNRKEIIEKQFSSWNGSHPALSRLIEKNMNDPDSYEHIETRFRDDGDYIFVVTKFRGANAFGGKVINTVSAKVDFEGNVIEVVE